MGDKIGKLVVNEVIKHITKVQSAAPVLEVGGTAIALGAGVMHVAALVAKKVISEKK